MNTWAGWGPRGGPGLVRRPEGAGGGGPTGPSRGRRDSRESAAQFQPLSGQGPAGGAGGPQDLNNAGAETALCLPFAPRKGDRLDLPRQVKLGSMEEELKRADVLLCFGGDGTILHAARDATLHDVPILGVNMGSVGFMAELERAS